MEVGRHRAMMVEEHITVDSNSYWQVKLFETFNSLLIYLHFILSKTTCISPEQASLLLEVHFSFLAY